MAKLSTQRRLGVQNPFELRPEMEDYYPMLMRFHTAMRSRAVLFPDLRVVHIAPDDISHVTDADAWVDDLKVMMRPSHEQKYACVFETIVNAGFCHPDGARFASGLDRVDFFGENLSVEHAPGKLLFFGLKIAERDEETIDVFRDQSLFDRFTDYPARCANRMKERIYAPRKGHLKRRNDTERLLRFGYLNLAVKVWLARAGFPEFCQPEMP